MTFTVIAVWQAQPGEEDRIRGVLETMTPLSRAEEGCVHYQAHVSVEHPSTFMLYEQYVDADAYAAHKASEHFSRHVVGHALDHLVERTVTTYETIGG